MLLPKRTKHRKAKVARQRKRVLVQASGVHALASLSAAADIGSAVLSISASYSWVQVAMHIIAALNAPFPPRKDS